MILVRTTREIAFGVRSIAPSEGLLSDRDTRVTEPTRTSGVLESTCTGVDEAGLKAMQQIKFS